MSTTHLGAGICHYSIMQPFHSCGPGVVPRLSLLSVSSTRCNVCGRGLSCVYVDQGTLHKALFALTDVTVRYQYQLEASSLTSKLCESVIMLMIQQLMKSVSGVQASVRAPILYHKAHMCLWHLFDASPVSLYNNFIWATLLDYAWHFRSTVSREWVWSVGPISVRLQTSNWVRSAVDTVILCFELRYEIPLSDYFFSAAYSTLSFSLIKTNALAYFYLTATTH